MKIGIPRGLTYYTYYPFWHAFFTELGVEIVLSDKAKIIGKMIKEISKPGSFIILLIKEGETYKVPDGNTVLEPNDKLVIITKTTNNAEILDIFGVEE